ncbi:MULTISPECIES: DUF3016 domain-containing protein [unclassified Roseateles]|jgi:hypothetical protein|uniref:DUF3016 domain-containing protein n=1 Tax=unclassified Roseateles TaxID=2626991 RepID=UPI0006FD8FEC|nr:MULTISPECIES: DUF3016 domain-containing protein [unclassified Roseateles]KQW41208.1 hypothetical protein ASC81_23305 [Pelomonas sp. Root405]KRA67980.1 hypothetical protein ASD88_21290 [Pelomonas sp. Root662]
MKYRWIALSLVAIAATARADVQVNFVQPEKFSDIKDNHGFKQLELLKDIEAHLVEQAAKRLPGRDVRINVTDVDLAGEVEPFGRRMEWLRVMRNITLPSIVFNYEVREGDKIVQQGEVKLRDMNYQDGFYGYSNSDTLRAEKRMIDRWFKEEFSPKMAAVR